MRFERHRYLQRLIAHREDGRIKAITGIEGCGKSYLLDVLFCEYLMKDGVSPEQIIMLNLDDDAYARYRNPTELGTYLRQKVSDTTKDFYILLDGIQRVESIPNPYLPAETSAKITFADVLLGLKSLPNVDVYVTCSDTKMLTSDGATALRDRYEEIHITPLTYDEFYAAYPGEKRFAWHDFVAYGGMPFVVQQAKPEEKSAYLRDLFLKRYLKDVIKRNRLHVDDETLEDLLNIVASTVGTFTNPTRLADAHQVQYGRKLRETTIAAYLEGFIDAFVLRKVRRWDIKRRRYINTPYKYYFTDVGLRNALLGFPKQENDGVLQNILYNELTARGFQVDVGVVEYNHIVEGKKVRSQLEVNFVANKIDKRFYTQASLTAGDVTQRMQAVQTLHRIHDSFPKIVVVLDNILPWTDNRG